MIDDPFGTYAGQPNFPAIGAFVITPNDSADLQKAVRQITIGTTGGAIAWCDVNGTTHTTGPLPLGTYPMAAHRVLASGTTAVGLTGWV